MNNVEQSPVFSLLAWRVRCLISKSNTGMGWDGQVGALLVLLIGDQACFQRGGLVGRYRTRAHTNIYIQSRGGWVCVCVCACACFTKKERKVKEDEKKKTKRIKFSLLCFAFALRARGLYCEARMVVGRMTTREEKLGESTSRVGGWMDGWTIRWLGG